MPQRRNTKRREPHKNGRMTKRRVSRKNGGRTKRRVSRKNRRTKRRVSRKNRRSRKTRRVVRKNQRGGQFTVGNLVMLGTLGLWFSGELDDLLVGPLTGLRSKEVKKVLKKRKRSLKKELNISSPLDKAHDALSDVFK